MPILEYIESRQDIPVFIPLHHADHRAARLQRHARRVPAPALGQRALDRVVRIHEPGRRGHHVLGPGSPGDPVRHRAVQDYDTALDVSQAEFIPFAEAWQVVQTLVARLAIRE